MIKDASDTLIGTILGNYRLERLIEYSQQGPVFLARSDTEATTYMVHFLDELTNQSVYGPNDYPEQFQYQAHRIIALQHPSILPLLDYGIYQGAAYLVSPYLAIRSLHSDLVNNKPMNAFTVGRYLDQIAAALEYAHEQGIFHGNLTLDCIFVHPNGRLVVADFGVRSLLELKAPENLLALRSKEYAPEQFLGRPTGPYTDVYALGAVLYQLLTGSPVFAGTTADEVTQQHLFSAVPLLSQQRSDLPAGLDSIIARALAKDPKQRYQQAGALANAYHQIVDPNDPEQLALLQSDPWANAYHQIVDLNERDHVPSVITSSPASQAQQPFDSGATRAEGQFTEREESTIGSVIVDCDQDMQHQVPETPTPTTLEDEWDTPTLKRVPVFPKQTSILPTSEDVSGADSPDRRSNRQDALLRWFQPEYTRRKAVITFLLLLIASSIVGIVLLSRQNVASAEFVRQVTFFDSSKILLGLCIVLAIAFTVGFNVISRVSLSTTRHESAYTILWQIFCALLSLFFLPFDRFSIALNPHALLLCALSVALWALVDAFLFSAFKYEEASVLSTIFPLNFVFTFVVSVIFFHAGIKPTIVIGFLVIMAASLLIGVYHTRFRPSKGVMYALIYSFLLGVALGLNSEVVKSFSIPPYMVAAFLFPALANQLIFLRPKVAELRYELRVQWKKILLNAAVMDVSFFFLLKAFQLGNVPQVVALSASSTLLTALAGIVVLKEDKHITLKIIAAGLATLGIILVQL